MVFDVSRLLVPVIILVMIALGEAIIVLAIWLENRKHIKREKKQKGGQKWEQ